MSKVDTVRISTETARKVLEAMPLYAQRDGDGDIWTLKMTGEQYACLRELVDACHRALSDEQAVAHASP